MREFFRKERRFYPKFQRKWWFRELLREILLAKRKFPKKAVASKHPSGLSSSKYDRSWFISADAEARFLVSITWHSGIKKKGFDLDIENAQVEDFQGVIQTQGWQMFCKHPKVIAMTVVREFVALYGVCKG